MKREETDDDEVAGRKATGSLQTSGLDIHHRLPTVHSSVDRLSIASDVPLHCKDERLPASLGAGVSFIHGVIVFSLHSGLDGVPPSFPRGRINVRR